MLTRMRAIAGTVCFHSAQCAPNDALEKLTAALTASHSSLLAQTAASPDACFAGISDDRTGEHHLEVQPLQLSGTSTLLVTTARLRNREDLARQLGWPAAGLGQRLDRELVAAAFERWGEDCPRHLDGPFSLAVWQGAERRLFCAVDRLASSPIYFCRIAGGIAFATTLNAILALPGQSRRLNRSAFAAYMANVLTDDEESFYEGIQRVRGGHALVIDARGQRTWRYHDPAPPAVLDLPSDAAYIETMREQFVASVRRSLRPASGQVGLYLSGGLDSSSVAAVAGRLLADEGRRLQAIHILPRGENRYRYSHSDLDEASYVRRLQAHAPHIDFHFVSTTSEPSPRATWDDYFAANRAPFPSLLSTGDGHESLLDQLGIHLMLDGIGGNHVVSLEALPSYLPHLAVSHQWLTWWRETRAYGRVQDRPLRQLVRLTAINPWKQRLRGRVHPLTFQNSPLWFLHPEVRRQTVVEQRLRAFHERWYAAPVDFRRHLADMIHEWAALSFAPRAAPGGGGVRFHSQPLHDRQLAAFCLSLPFDQQVRDGWDRRLLREAMRGWLPDEVRLRVTRGLPQPEFQSNFTRALPMLREELSLLGSSALERELLDCERIRDHWRRHESQPTMHHEHRLVKGLVAAAFLRWHERQGGG